MHKKTTMNELLDHPLLTAMGYALLHSVWVFGLLILAGQLIAGGFTDPARRHAILLAVLTALPFLFGLLVYLGLPAESVRPQGLVPASDMLLYPGETSAVYAPSAVGWLSSWLPVLSVIYLLGLLLAA
ncbi:MAG: hypothetical protein WA952_00335, partial [Lewinella sp.]